MTAEADVTPHDGASSVWLSEQLRQSLVLAMERGSLSTVRYRIETDGFACWASLLSDGELATWMARAEAHEAKHGPDSFLVKEHRFNVEMLPWILRCALEPDATTADAPGAMWSMEQGWHDIDEVAISAV